MARKKRALFMTVGTGFKDNQKINFLIWRALMKLGKTIII